MISSKYPHKSKLQYTHMMNILLICDYPGITLAEFFDIEMNNPALIKELIGYLKQLDCEQLKNVTAIVKSLEINYVQNNTHFCCKYALVTV